MIGESKNKLNEIGYSRGKAIYRYNFEQVVRDGETFWQFEWVYIDPPVTKDKIIEALIGEKYSIPAEIALINNKLAGAKNADVEYAEYLNHRNQIKSTAKENLISVKS